MGQIRIDTERVREVGQRLIAEAERIHETGVRLSSTVNHLDIWAWDGISRARAEPLLEQIRPQTDQCSQELQRLGQILQHVADIFEEQDKTTAQNLTTLPWIDWESGGADVMDDLGSILSDMSEEIRAVIMTAGIVGLVEFLKDDFELSWALLESKDIWKGLQIFKGHSYPGQLIFQGSHSIKDVAGFSPYLTHVKFSLSQTAFDMGKDSFLEALGIGNSTGAKIGVALNVLTVGVNGFENWEKYKDEGISKVAAGTIVDSAMDIGLSVAGAGLGAWGGAIAGGALLGAVSGGVLAPVGAAIGSKIGGFAGSWAGGWVSNKLQETDMHEQVVDWTADRFDDAYEIGSQVVDAVGDSIREGAKKVDQALDSAIDGLIKLF